MDLLYHLLSYNSGGNNLFLVALKVLQLKRFEKGDGLQDQEQILPDICVVTEMAGTGISAHADRRQAMLFNVAWTLCKDDTAQIRCARMTRTNTRRDE